MTFNYSYELTQKAQKDLDEILTYITIQLDNPQYALEFINNLTMRIDEVRLFPDSGSPVFNEYVANIGLRKKIVDNYIMYYYLNTEKKIIYIVRIIYSKRNIDEILFQMNFNNK